MSPLRRLLGGLVAVLVLVPCLVPAEALAQRRDEENKQRGGSWARKNEVDKLTLKRIQKAQQHLADEEYPEAHEALDKLRVRSLNDLERFSLYEMRGFIYFNEQKLDEAKEAMEQALEYAEVGGLDRCQTLRFLIGQIGMQQSDWKGAIESFESWFEYSEDPNANAYYMLALAYWQLKDLEGARVPAQKAVDLTSEPQESWLQLLLAIHLTAKNYDEAIPIYDVLVRRYPKKSYWIQLSTLHGALGNYEKSLIPLQLAYTQGLLTEDSEFRRLAELLLFLELPIRAVDVIQQGIEKEAVEHDAELYELLSNSLIMAREYDEAVAPLTRAAELDESGRIYLRLAEVHIQRERWDDATDALRLAIEKGDLPNPGQAELLMGISFYSQKKPERAVDWFVKAKRFDGTKAEATTWLNHIAREQSANADA